LVWINLVGNAGPFNRKGPILDSGESNLQFETAELKQGHLRRPNFVKRRRLNSAAKSGGQREQQNGDAGDVHCSLLFPANCMPQELRFNVATASNLVMKSVICSSVILNDTYLLGHP
jgi:hypothetical protein